MVGKVNVLHGDIWPYHISTVFVGSSPIFFKGLIVFKQCCHAVGDGMRVLKVGSHDHVIRYYLFGLKEWSGNYGFPCTESI
jgi:hypothetical protein